MLNNTSKKLLLGFLGIITVGAIIWIGSTYFNPEARQERTALKYFEDLERQYKDDTYGGATPEATLELFIAALEAGDIELASKYFLPDDRNKWVDNLEKIQETNNLSAMIQDISRAEKSTQENDTAIFVVTNEENIVSVLINLDKNPATGVWKITDL